MCRRRESNPHETCASRDFEPRELTRSTTLCRASSHSLRVVALIDAKEDETLARAAVARFMPPVVTRLLVPIVWRRKWAPMRPFLLP